jgi:hypothetical protein
MGNPVPSAHTCQEMDAVWRENGSVWAEEATRRCHNPVWSNERSSTHYAPIIACSLYFADCVPLWIRHLHWPAVIASYYPWECKVMGIASGRHDQLEAKQE